MKNNGYESYSDFYRDRNKACKPLKTLEKEIAAIEDNIKLLEEQHDYSSLDTIRRLTDIITNSEEKEALTMSMMLFDLTRLNADNLHFVSCIISELWKNQK